jgi:hypothetical protein
LDKLRAELAQPSGLGIHFGNVIPGCRASRSTWADLANAFGVIRFHIDRYASNMNVERFTRVPDSAINDDMSTQELINKEIENLPEPLQQEVYDFAHFLHLKSKGELQLLEEFESWEAASNEDFLKLERTMAEVE